MHNMKVVIEQTPFGCDVTASATGDESQQERHDVILNWAKKNIEIALVGKTEDGLVVKHDSSERPSPFLEALESLMKSGDLVTELERFSESSEKKLMDKATEDWDSEGKTFEDYLKHMAESEVLPKHLRDSAKEMLQDMKD